MNSFELKMEGINKKYSSLGGMKIFAEMVEKLQLEKRLEKYMPKKKREVGVRQIDKFITILYSLICGADCLDDIDGLLEDQLFSELTNGGLVAITAGDFLRSFNGRMLEELREKLIEIALDLRGCLFPDKKEFILMMDSTPHEHYGKKFEGINWNYKNLWCLDSLSCYDQYGFHYDFDLRAGNTYSSEGAELMIRKVFKHVEKDYKKYFRADSAFGRVTIYNELINAGVKFAIALKANVYKSVLEKNKNLITWKEKKMKFFGSKTCEVGTALYWPEGLSGNVGSLKVLLIRVEKEKSNFEISEENLIDGYAYYAVVTNIYQHEMNDEKLIKFYRGRSNGENFIREEKNGLDLRHFPCKKLTANHTYGIIAILAYNILRYVSFLLETNGCFSKKIRNKLLFIGCQIVKHARSLTIKINYQTKEVIDRILQNIYSRFKRYQLSG